MSVETLTSGQTISNMHPAGTCYGEHCPIHNPSDHEYLDKPLAMLGSSMVRIWDKSEEPEVNSGWVSWGSVIPGVFIPDWWNDRVFIIIDPDDYAYSQGDVILRNSGVCQSCGDEVESFSRHHMNTCSCGKSMVDGGNAYLRHGGDIVSTSIVFYRP